MVEKRKDCVSLTSEYCTSEDRPDLETVDFLVGENERGRVGAIDGVPVGWNMVGAIVGGFVGKNVGAKVGDSVVLIAGSIHVDPSPLQTPQASSRALPFGVPAQSEHVDPSPLQTPQASSRAPPFGVPAQSAHVNPSPLQTPQASSRALPF